jgi:S-adenosylmethionine-diacylglycerol 3-amino-3-carboxypropyl transferase
MTRDLGRTYFDSLNYTLGNEDTSLELALLPNRTHHVLAIAGSGGRVLPLLAKRPRYVTCVDVAIEQLYLTELRIESARALEHQEFLAFWGYPPVVMAPEERVSLFRKITLSEPARRFCAESFASIQWASILYQGRWERTFAKLSRVNRVVLGSRGSRLFETGSSAEYFAYLLSDFPHRSWSVLVRLLGNASVFNALLYKGNFVVKNMPGSAYEFYLAAFERLFQQGHAKENFFLQLLFFGEIRFSEANPVECDQKVFAQVKEALAETQISYVHGDVLRAVPGAGPPVDFLSLSDVPSYFRGATERTFLQDLRDSLSPDALVVIRNYLRVPEGTDLTGYRNITADHQDIVTSEKVQMYLVDILRHTG